MKYHLGLEQLPICRRRNSSSGLMRIISGREAVERMEDGRSETVCSGCWAKYEKNGRKVKF